MTSLEDEGIVLHLGDRRYVSVSESGRIILEALETPKTRDELVDLLLDEYDVGREEARQTVNEFVDQCVQANLLFAEEES